MNDYMMVLSLLRAKTHSLHKAENETEAREIDNEMCKPLAKAIGMAYTMPQGQRKVVLEMAINQAVNTRRKMFA